MTRKIFSFLHTYKNSLYFLMLSFLSGALNYIYYPMIARMLSVEEFGSSQALITLLTQAGSLFAGLSLLSIFLVKKHGSIKATEIINQAQKIIITTLIFITLIVGGFHGFISQFLNMKDSLSIIIVSVDLALSIPFIVTFGIMLAEKRFLSAAYMQLLVVFSKLTLGAILVPIFQSTGAIVAIGISYLVGMGAYWILARLLKKVPWSHNVLRAYIPPKPSDLANIIPYALPIASILITATVLVIIPGLDVLIARHYLDTNTAGIYSAASTISSVILFASLPVINILIPLIDSDNPSQSTPQIKKAIVILLSIAIVSLLSFLILPKLLLSILGNAYLQYSSVLILFGVNMLFICGLTLLLQILALYSPYLAMLLSLLAITGTLTLTNMNHDSGPTIIKAAATSYGIMMTVSTIVIVYYTRRRAGQKWLSKN